MLINNQHTFANNCRIMLDSSENQLCFVCDNQVVKENSYTILYTSLANGKVLLSESVKKVINCDIELANLSNGILCRRCFLLFDELELACIKCQELHETILKYYSAKTAEHEVCKGSNSQRSDLDSQKITDTNEDCSGTGALLKPVKGVQNNKRDENEDKTGEDSDVNSACQDRTSDNSIKQIECNNIHEKSSPQLNTVTVTESDNDFTWPISDIGDESEDNIKVNKSDKDEMKNKQQIKEEICETATKDSYEENKELKKSRKQKHPYKVGSMYVCDICGKQWQRASQLRLHEVTHSELRPYICEICGQAYKHKHARDIHVGMHQGINPFLCHICGKAFTQKCALQRHLPIHTKEAPYQCEYCGKLFVHHTSFNMHTLVHTGEKMYKCKVCGLALLSGSHLKRHTRIHTGERPFACSQCGKRFAEKYNLMAHQKIHSGPDNVISHRKTHVCKVCGLSFDRKPKLEDHLIICHNKIVDEPRPQWITQLYPQGNEGTDSAAGETENLTWNNTLAIKKTTMAVEHTYSVLWESS